MQYICLFDIVISQIFLCVSGTFPLQSHFPTSVRAGQQLHQHNNNTNWNPLQNSPNLQEVTEDAVDQEFDHLRDNEPQKDFSLLN